MKILIALLLAAPLFAQQTPFRLQPGEYRWIPFTVKQTPTEIECRFQVVSGKPTVHMELLSMHDFRLFSHEHQHQTLAVSPDARAGAFRRIMDDRGPYAVVVMNGKNAPAADILLEVKTDLDPTPLVMTRELSPGRRLTVILISFAVFFVTVTWSGFTLMRAIRRSDSRDHSGA